MGAVPESQLKTFVERLTKAGGGGQDDGIEDALAMARESLELGDLGGAAQAYAQVLQHDPENVKALGGMARVYLAGGEPDRAREILEMAPADAKDADLDSVRAALALAADAPADVREFQDRLDRDPADHEARLELAKALGAHGRLEEAMDHLLTIIEADREWNEQAARKQLLVVFEAAGQMSELAKQGRRRLSAILFS
jgi:putative thioredoxin